MSLKRFLSFIVALAMMITLLIPAAVSSEGLEEVPEVTESVDGANDASTDDEAPADEAPADEAPADEAPADEAPADEAPADEAPADEAPADEAPADEAPADEAPAAEEASEEEDQVEEAVFENGYVRVSAGTAVYQDANKNNKVGVINGSSVVYAVMAAKAEDMQNSWLKVSFDTDTEDAVVTGYVQMKSVTVLSAEEAANVIGALKADGNAKEYNGCLLPIASFTYEVAEPASDPEEVSEDEEVLEDEEVETDASVAITAQPQDTTVPDGGKATFSVTASGTGLTYQWQVKTDAAASWKNTTLNGCKTNKLSFNVVGGYNNRQYRCVVTDSQGNTATSNAATLTVGASVAFAITSQPQDVTVNANATATFTVAATGTGLHYQWQYRTSATASWANTGLSGNKTAELSFKALGGYTGRQFRCVVTDANGDTLESDPATLTVGTTAAFAITAQPQDVTVNANATATFTVAATGAGLTYQWQVKTSATADWANTGLSGNKTAELSFKALGGYNGRQFRCVVTNASGNTLESEAATLTVGTTAAFAITAQPQDVTVNANATATFTVAATGAGLTYQWQYRTSATASWANTGLSGNKTAELSFKALGGYNGRQFRCVVTNANGNTLESDPATLTVGTTAAFAITAQPQDVTVNANATATFTVAATGAGLTYQWQVKTSATADWANTGLSGNKTAELSFKALGGYNGRQFRCVVTNASGNTLESDPATLTVGTSVAFAITAQPQDVTVLAGETATFTVVATGTGLTYQWQVKTDEAAAWKGTSLNGNKTAELSFSAAKTFNNRQYRCIVTDANGNKISSDPATLFISEPAVELAITSQPQDVEVAAGQTATFSVAATGTGLTYQWQTLTSAGGTWKATTLNGYNTDTLSFEMKTAYANRQYRCIVKDSSGEQVVSDSALLTLPEPLLPVSQPESVTCAANDNVSFTFVVNHTTGVTYCWQVSTDNGVTWKNTTLNGYATDTLAFKALGGYNGRQYRCVVTNAKGETVTSDPVTLTVSWTKVVDGVTYQQIDANTCKVTGYNGTASSLTIPATVDGAQVVEIGEEAFMGNTTLTSIDLPNTIEVIRARAFKNCTSLSSMTTH